MLLKRLAAVAVLAALSFGCSSMSEQTEALIGKTAPYTRLTMIDGSYLPLSNFRGKTLVLAFWATYCSHSKGMINDLKEYVKNHNNPGVEYIAVSLDDALGFETLQNMIQLQGLDVLRHAYSGNEARDEAFLAFKLTSIPMIVVIGPDGEVKSIGRSVRVVRRNVE